MKFKTQIKALLVLVSLVAGGIFTSCKDDAADLYTEQGLEIADLKNQLNQAIDDLKNLLASCKADCQQQWNDLNNKIAANTSSINDIKKELANLASLQATINQLQTQITNLTNKVTVLENFQTTQQEFNSSVSQFMDNVNGEIESIKAILDKLGGFDVAELLEKIDNIQTQLDSVSAAAFQALANTKTNADAIKILEDKVDSLLNLGVIMPDIKGLQDSLATLYQRHDSLLKAFEEAKLADGDYQALLEKLGLTDVMDNGVIYDIPELVNTVQQHSQQIAELQKETSEIFGYLNNLLDELITSLIAQNVYNNVFGSFALPIGINSNILMAYYGQNDVPTNDQFPTNYTEAEYISGSVDDMISSSAWNALGLNSKKISIPDGVLLANDGNMGKIYLTINPSNVDFTQQKVELSLVNSQGEPAALSYGQLTLSDEVLYFGNSRAAKTYLYELPVTVEESGLSSMKFDIDGQALATSFKKIIDDRGISDVANFGRTLYSQVNNKLQAYALQTFNTVGASDQGNIAAKDRTVTSQYNIAATCIEPLSFRFLAGQGISRDLLPIISPLSEYLDKILNKININVKSTTLDFGNFEITINDLINISLNPTDEFEMTISSITYTDQATGEQRTLENVTFKATAADLMQAIQKALAQGGITVDLTPLNEKFAAYMANVQAQVQKSFDELVNNINDQFNSIKDDIAKDLKGGLNRLDGFINKYNSFATRINNVFKNPNHYLQVTAIYEDSEKNYHQLSNSLTVPSRFRQGSGDAIQMYLTTYTAELVVPTFKKYVAVTNVFNASDRKQATDWQAQVKSVNTDQLNTVLQGRQIRFALPTSNLKAGYIYEITYQAMDYHGITSTRKMYLEVVD